MGRREVARHAPGLLWVAFVFASLIGLNRAFALELENDALSGLALAPVDRGWVFLGKALSNVLLIDALTMEFRTMKVRRDPNCPLCGDHPTVKELIDYDAFCGSPPLEMPAEAVAAR